jgi:hypothetical protein
VLPTSVLSSDRIARVELLDDRGRVVGATGPQSLQADRS